MRIGIVCHPTMGGSGLLATQLGVHLSNKGYEIDIITYETPFLLRFGNARGVNIRFVDWPEHALFRYPPYTSALANKICLLHKRKPFDLIHVHYAIPHALAAFISREICGVPYVVTLHGSDIHTLGIDPNFKNVVSFSIKKANAVTSISQNLIDIAETELDIKGIIKVPNFIDCNLYSPKNKKVSDFVFKEEDELLITHSSNFRPVKRTLDLVKAFSKVRKEIPKARLLLVGDGPQRSIAWNLIQELDIESSVTSLGVRQDIPDILSETDVYALTSEIEGCPLSLLEAMSSGIPVVSTDVGGVPELVDHNSEGLLTSKGNVEEISEHLIKLLKNKELRQEMGDKAHKKVCQFFKPHQVVPQYEAVYNKILNK
ncbi:MAG: N-acetyl-alpha-D-glucosaminyl L-malate synthase BshA [Candidatus Ranarchaeia archaeon]